ncbi:MAG TPA: response regulator transcription factor [Thermoanaerobaculia bacterium]
MNDSVQSTRVAVVEDDPQIRAVVRQMIDAEEEFHCAGAYESAEHALRAIGGHPADVLLLDIHLPGMHGNEAVLLFRERHPDLRIIMFTVFEDDRRVFTSICNGAVGYVLKKTPPPKLIDALRDARDGGAPISPEIARRVIELFRRRLPRKLAADPLTPAEIRLLGYLSEGCSYQRAAERMNVSINTIRDYVRSTYEKLHVHSKSAAVSKALRAGLI